MLLIVTIESKEEAPIFYSEDYETILVFAQTSDLTELSSFNIRVNNLIKKQGAAKNAPFEVKGGGGSGGGH